MKAPVAKRIYNISDAAIVQLSDSLIDSATRDIAELAAFGWDAAKLTLIRDKRNNFSDFETDEELSALMVSATANKNTSANDLRVKLRQLRSRFINKYGENSPEDRRIAINDLSKLDDNELVRAAKRAHRVATSLLAELSSEGLTAAILLDIGTNITAFDDFIDDKDTAIRNRDIAVENRIKLGNALYTELVKLANSGKTLWESTNEAKYNDYVLTAVASNMEVVEGSIGAGAIVNVSLSVADGAASLTISNTGTAEFAIYFATLPTDDKQSPAANIPGGTTQTVTAAAIGFDAATKTRLNVINSSQTEPTSYRIVME